MAAKSLVGVLAVALAVLGCGNSGPGGGGDGGGNGDGGDFPPDGGTPISVCAETVAARGPHTCAVDEEGGVLCWGRNHRGQLGNGGTSESAPPHLVDLPGEARAVETGIAHTCALVRDGRVFCWGYGEVGSLGDGGFADRSTPVEVSGISDAVALFSGGFHVCALRSGGELRCWGDNSSGQIGDGGSGDGADRATPVSVASSVRAAALGEEHTCIVTTAGAVECWGLGEAGQLGDGTRDTRAAAGPVTQGGAPLTGVAALAAGAYHTCAVLEAGAVLCWGMNDRGQMGDGTQGTDRLEPAAVTGLSAPQKLVGGVYHTCALSGAGELSCWGDNRVGQLGTGDTLSRTAPVAIAGLGTVEDVAAGDIHGCAVTGGDVLCWGDNRAGQVGASPGQPIHSPIVALACR